MTATSKKVIFEKTISGGAGMAVVFDRGYLLVNIDGVEKTRGVLRELDAEDLRGRHKNAPKGTTALIGAACFTSPEAAILREAIAEAQAWWESERSNVRKQAIADKDARIPGYSILAEALEARERYEHRVARSFDDENTSSFVVAKPKLNYDALAKQYPRAELYLRLESALGTSHSGEKSFAIQSAMDVLESGGPIEDAIKSANNWIS